MRILFYARDIGPAKNLGLIEVEALRRGHSKHSVLGGELGPVSFSSINQPEVIVTGLSSFKNEEELALGALTNVASIVTGIPWVVVADSHRTWSRPAAAGRVSNAVLFVASPAESEEALAFGYGRVEYLGGPPIWQEFPATRTVSLERRTPESKVILVSGIKDGRLTDELLEAVVRAMRTLGVEWELVFRPHPREDPATVSAERREKILAGVEQSKTPAQTSQLIGSVDLSVFTSGATGTIEAAYKRRPVVYFENERVRERMLTQSDSTQWFPTEAGACVKANEETMTEVIRRLLTPEGAAELRARQEEVYPIPPPDGERVETRIVRFLEELVGKK